jgi:hypothetical protein
MLFVERPPNHGQEFIRLNRFLQESLGAGIKDTFFVCSPVTSGQNDYRDGRQIEVCFQHIQDNESIPDRQAQIQYDQVWRMPAGFRNGPCSVLCTIHIVATRLEPYLEGLPNFGVVIHDQNVRLTHFATYLVIGKLERDRKEIFTQFFDILKALLIAGKLYPDRS